MAVLLPITAGATESRGTFYGGLKTEYPKWFKESFLDFREDIEEAKLAGKRVMVLFHQNGCPYCNALVERNLSQKDIEDMIKKNFDVVAINMWGDREVATIGGKQYKEKAFAQALKIQFTPTILFFDESGKIILRLNGYLPPRVFKVALDYVAQHKERTISYRDYVAKSVPSGKTGQLINEDFFEPPPFDLRRKKGSKSKPFAVFFEQKDCPNCGTLHRRVLVDKETRDIVKQFDNVQLDMWSKTEVITPEGKKMSARDWARALDVKYAPTIVLFNNKGSEIIRSEASFKVFHTQGIFHYVLSGSYKKQPSFQRYLSARAEHIMEQGKDVDIDRYADEKIGTAAGKQ